MKEKDIIAHILKNNFTILKKKLKRKEKVAKMTVIFEEFIVYINKNVINYSGEINESVFETNPLLLTKVSIEIFEWNCKIKFDCCPCLMESIKCHHNEFANYIKNQMEDDVTNKPIFSSCLKYHNFFELFVLIDKIGFESFDKFDTLEMFTGRPSERLTSKILKEN